jgi:hypothetical protein
MIARTDGRLFICSFCSVFRALLHHVSHKIPAVVFCEKAAAMHVYCLQWKDLAHRFLRHLARFARLKGTGHVQQAIVARSVPATVVVSDSLS